MKIEDFNRAKELLEKKDELAAFREVLERNPDTRIYVRYINVGNCEAEKSVQHIAIGGMLCKFLADMERDIDKLIEKI